MKLVVSPDHFFRPMISRTASQTTRADPLPQPLSHSSFLRRDDASEQIWSLPPPCRRRTPPSAAGARRRLHAAPARPRTVYSGTHADTAQHASGPPPLRCPVRSILAPAPRLTRPRHREALQPTAAAGPWSATPDGPPSRLLGFTRRSRRRDMRRRAAPPRR
jgi:hypothetical protein